MAEPENDPDTFGVDSDHRRFVSLFDEFLGATYPPAGGNVKTGRRKFATSMVDQFDRRGSTWILDCAAGTGFPCLDIAAVAPGRFNLDCCDRDLTMIEMLEQRAAESGTDLVALGTASSPSSNGAVGGPSVLHWIELDRLERQYDYVMCRGNSLAYADTWDGDDHVASRHLVKDYLEHIGRRVRPGGHLHVDAPLTEELPRTIRRELETNRYSIIEEVEVTDGARRRWTVEFSNPSETVEFVRYSSLLTIHQVQVMLDDLGFTELDLVDLDAERDNYGVIIARRPS